MIQKFNIFFILTTLTLLLFGNMALGQKCEAKKRISTEKQTSTTSMVAITKVTQKRVRIDLPPNYEPPVANDKMITFPETVATKKQQKKLIKKRQKISKRKKGKKQGCVAANM